MQLSGNKPAAAAKPAAAPSAPEGGAGAVGHVMMGAEYPPHNRRLKNIQMVKYNFEDDLYDECYYGAQDMYYPNHGYHPGMRHMSLPPPHCSNYLPPPPPYGHGPYPPHRHFSHAPPPWQRFPPVPPPPWAPFGQRRYFGHPRPHFAPPMGHAYFGAYLD